LGFSTLIFEPVLSNFQRLEGEIAYTVSAEMSSHDLFTEV
jgi:hypothetical protein